MNERDFCFWLNGFFELSGQTELSAQQVEVIKEHLKLVFQKQTTKVVEGLKFINPDNPSLAQKYNELYCGGLPPIGLDTGVKIC